MVLEIIWACAMDLIKIMQASDGKDLCGEPDIAFKGEIRLSVQEISNNFERLNKDHETLAQYYKSLDNILNEIKYKFGPKRGATIRAECISILVFLFNLFKSEINSS